MKHQALSPSLDDSRPALAGSVLLLGSAVLYGYTVAPTLLWGDDAMFQRALALGVLTNHPIWGILARLFARLPWGDLSFKANLISAVSAVGAVAFLFLTTRVAGGSNRAALVGGVTLAIAHTFWLQAVRAEVYTLHLLLFLAGLWALLRWRRETANWLWLVLGLALWLIGTVNHLLLTTALPGGAWLLWTAIPRPHRKRTLLRLMVLAAGGAVVTAVLAPAFITQVVPDTARVVLATLRFSPRWMLAHLALLVYQFPLLWVLAMPGFRHLWYRDRDVAISLAWIAVPTAAFAATHGILESYVFYLPVYALLALSIGLGSDSFTHGWSWPRWLVAGSAILALHVGIYRLTPLLLERLAPRLIYARDLPGRAANHFFLWPPKRSYVGARWFAETTMGLLPPEAIIIADWTPFTPLQYLQDVEGQRPDVLIVQPDSRGMQIVRENGGQRPLFLANADPRYYPVTELADHYHLEPVGHIYALVPQETHP